MKTLFLILILAFSALSQVDGNPTEKNLVLNGTVTEIAAENTNLSNYVVYIKLNLSLKNESSVPVIFLQPKPIVSSALLNIGNEAIPETLVDLIAKSDDSQTSFAMNRKTWDELKKSLKKSVPPKDKTLTILPNQTVNFDGFVKFKLPSLKNQTLSLIQMLSPVELNLTCQTWSTLPLIIDNKSADSLKLKFAKQLQKKWKKSGYVWFETIDSKPVSIDFNLVVYKKLIEK
jgi:hypothetical protein